MRLLIFLVGFLCAGLGAAPHVEFVASEPHGLVNFAQTIAGLPGRSATLRKFFERSRFATPAVREKIERFRALYTELDQTLAYAGYPGSRHIGINVGQLILTRSAWARDLADLSERTLGLVPIALHARFFAVLGELDPIYRELVWMPSRRKLRRKVAELKAIGRRARLDDMFRRARTFYRSEWPPSEGFRVAVYPVPGAHGDATSESLMAFESLGVLLDRRGAEQTFGVLFHELCHSLYDSQPAAVQAEIEAAFSAMKGLAARFTYRLFNEALATAAGNGWAYRRATRKLDPGSWYDHPYVDGFGKALQPLVARYLDRPRAMDAAFLQEAVRTFEKTFPDAAKDRRNLMTHVTLIVDETVLPSTAAARRMHATFSIWSLSTTTFDDPQRLASGLAGTFDTVVAVVSPGHRDWVKKIPAALLADAVVLVAEDAKELDERLKALKLGR